MLLQLKDISLSFTDNRNETLRLLNGLTLNVPKGKITVLVGGNGSGKTTLFNIISGFQNSYQGEITFNGEKLNHLPPAKIARKGIGRLFQGRQLFGDLTLLENMCIASADDTGEIPFSFLIRGKTIARQENAKIEKAANVLDTIFGANNKYAAMLQAPASTLSYGEQRLMGLARLLMGNSSLLLLDEPTSGVHPTYIETIGRVIKTMTQTLNLTVLLIEHNMGFVREIADHCAYLNEGRIKHEGSADTVLNTDDVKQSYLGLLNA